MIFKKFRSLHNVKQKLVNLIISKGLSNIKWMVTEKVHGANFGVHLDRAEGIVRFSRRTDYLIDGENFYSYNNISDSLIPKIQALSSMIEGDTVRVYGELCGGYFYGMNRDNSTRIQKEVQYSPDTQFLAFSIEVDDERLPASIAHRLLKESGFEVVPVIAIVDSIQDALDIPNDSDSLVPKLLGLEAEKGNTMEGTVIEPLDSVEYFGDRLLVLKNKNSKFYEKTHKKISLPKELSDTVSNTLKDFLPLISLNRLSNVLSKELEVTAKDFGRISGLLVQDAISEYSLEHSVNLRELLGDEWKIFNREVSKESANVTREYWIEEFA